MSAPVVKVRSLIGTGDLGLKAGSEYAVTEFPGFTADGSVTVVDDDGDHHTITAGNFERLPEVSAPVDVLANVLSVIDRLIASVEDDEIELDARADLAIAGPQARAAVAELVEAASRLERITIMTGHPKDDAAVRRLRAALAKFGGAA